MFVKSAVNSARATAHSEGKHCQLEKEVIQRPRICKDLATKYDSYTANEADEEGEHPQRTFQQNSVNRIRHETGKFTVKIIFFNATIGSKNYTICKIDTRSIFATDWGQPITLFTVLQQALFYNEQFRTPIMFDMQGSDSFCQQNPYSAKFSFKLTKNFHSISFTSKRYVCIAALYINTAVSFKSNHS